MVDWSPLLPGAHRLNSRDFTTIGFAASLIFRLLNPGFDLARIGISPHGDPLLYYLGAVWRSWGGIWGGERDPVHFQPPV